MHTLLTVLVCAILLCIGILTATTVSKQRKPVTTMLSVPSPVLTPRDNDPIRFVPENSQSIPISTVSGSVYLDRVDQHQPSTASAMMIFRQGDTIITQDSSTVVLTDPMIQITLEQNSKCSAHSLVPEKILLTLSQGQIKVKTQKEISVRTGSVLYAIASGSAIIDFTSNEKTKIQVIEGSALASFVNTDNETDTIKVNKTKTATINLESLTATISSF